MDPPAEPVCSNGFSRFFSRGAAAPDSCGSSSGGDGEVFSRGRRGDPCGGGRGVAGEVRCVNDPVRHPAHYTQGRIECWDFIADQGLDYFLGCAVKYIVRCGKKGDAIEDLRKAEQYIRKKIELLEFEASKVER